MKNRRWAVVVSIVTGVAAGLLMRNHKLKKKVTLYQQLADKHLVLYQLMDEWVHIKQEGKNLERFFTQNHYKNIAVYGMNLVGRTLVKELKGTDIHVSYAVDQNADKMYTDIEVKTPQEELPKVDVMVVTPITYFDQIEAAMQNKIDCPLVSIDDILYEL